MTGGFEPLTNPPRVYSRVEVLAKESPVPREPGVYAWYFRSVPDGVPTTGCSRYGDLTLLYVGISPKAPSRSGGPSQQNLWSRIRRNHMRGNAGGSTLRLSLGCLLEDELGIELRRLGSGNRMTFGEAGEQALSEWLAANGFVAWHVHPEPWELERKLIPLSVVS